MYNIFHWLAKKLPKKTSPHRFCGRPETFCFGLDPSPLIHRLSYELFINHIMYIDVYTCISIILSIILSGSGSGSNNATNVILLVINIINKVYQQKISSSKKVLLCLGNFLVIL